MILQMLGTTVSYSIRQIPDEQAQLAAYIPSVEMFTILSESVIQISYLEHVLNKRWLNDNKGDTLPQGSKLGSITKKKYKFVMKNISDNWDFCGKICQELMMLSVCSQKSVPASFLNTQIFQPYHKPQKCVNKFLILPPFKSLSDSKPYW